MNEFVGGYRRSDAGCQRTFAQNDAFGLCSTVNGADWLRNQRTVGFSVVQVFGKIGSAINGWAG